jgi:plastocyanin
MITATIRNVVVAAMLQVTVLTAAAIFSFPAKAADPVVKIDNFTFDPTKLTVKVGTTVTWYNEDDIPHAIASSTKVFKSKALDTDDKFSFTFSTPGVYEYFCSLHPHMTGAIVVEAGAADATGQ